MSIHAISSVTNKSYSNINFEKRKEKPVKNQNVTSPMKAVPLAALIAMSPLTTNNAANIMKAENKTNTVELAQAPEEHIILMYGDAFTSANGTKVTVMALNTKGGSDSYDKILLKAGNYTFEAKELLLRNAYLWSSNKVKEGPLKFKEVIAETEIDGKKERYSFVDPTIVNYVEALVAQPTNKSNIKNMRQADLNLVVANSKGDLLDLTDENLKFYFEKFSIKRSTPGSLLDNLFDEIYVGPFHQKRLWEQQVQGSHGNYTLRFYDDDGNFDNAENIVLKKDGYRDCSVEGVVLVTGKLHGVDDAISTGTASVIHIGIEPLTKEDRYITDDILANEIIKIYNSSKYNKSQKFPITINQTESNLVLGDY